MGLLDVILGRRKLTPPAADRLFAISTAYVTLTETLGIESSRAAAIVLQTLSTADYNEILRDAESVVTAVGADSGTTVEATDDRYGFRWLVLCGPSFDDLVVGINAVRASLEAGGYAERVLCAVFGFADTSGGRRLYLMYNPKRGTFYPFVPTGREGERDTERELALKAQLGADLPIEPELARWFPLWGIEL